MIASLAVDGNPIESKDFVVELYSKSFMGMSEEYNSDTAQEIFIINLTIEGSQMSCEEED